MVFFILSYLFVKDNLKREDLRQTLETQSSDLEIKMQQEFAAALEMQQKSAEEATALKAELARTARDNESEMNELAEKVRRGD